MTVPDAGNHFDERDLATLTEHVRYAVSTRCATVAKYRLEARCCQRKALTATCAEAEWLRQYAALLTKACDAVEAPLRPPEAKALPAYRVNAAALKARVDLVMFLEHRGVRLVKYGRQFRALCPLHDERTPSFFVDPELQRWICRGRCGTSGDIFDFVMLADRLTFSEAVQTVAREAGCPV